jgi:hypothetical protein
MRGGDPCEVERAETDAIPNSISLSVTHQNHYTSQSLPQVRNINSDGQHSVATICGGDMALQSRERARLEVNTIEINLNI